MTVSAVVASEPSGLGGGEGGVSVGGGGWAHPAAVTAAAVFGCARPTERCERIANTLASLQQALGVGWPLLLRDFVRGAFLIQLDSSAGCRESTATAFAYLKVCLVHSLFKRD